MVILLARRCRYGELMRVQMMASIGVARESVLVLWIHSEAVLPVEVVERARLVVLLELTQPASIQCVEPDVPMQAFAWWEVSSVQPEQLLLLKVKEFPPSLHSSGTGLPVGPDEYVARKRWWQEPSRHVRDKRETIQWPWSWNHEEVVEASPAFKAE